MGKPQGKKAVQFSSCRTSPLVASQDSVINGGKEERMAYKLLLENCNFYSVYIRNTEHPSWSTKTFSSYRELVGLVRNACNYEITRSARMNSPSHSRHLVSSQNLMLRIFWWDVVYKELCTTAQQELCVLLSAATLRFHTLPCDRHQLLQDYVFPSCFALWKNITDFYSLGLSYG